MKSYTYQTIKIFWQTTLKYPLLISIVVLTAVLASTVHTGVAVFQRDLINALSTGQSVNVVLAAFFKIYAALWAMWLLWRISGFANSYFQTNGKRDLYQKCFNFIHGHSVGFFNNVFVGSMVRKINKYDRAFEDVTDQFFWNLIPTFSSLILVMIVLYRTNLTIAVIFSAWVVFYLVFAFFSSKIRMKYDLVMNDNDSRATGFVADTITNQSNIKLFSALSFEGESFGKIVKEWRDAMVKTWQVGLTIEALQGFFMIGVDMVIIFISIKLWSEGVLSVGEVVMIQAFMVRIFDKLWEIGRNIRKLYQGFADANEMTEILLTPYQIKDAKYPKEMKVSDGVVAFDKVSFGYSKDRRIFSNFSLKVASGEKIGLVGPSGGGKSTISKLLLRFMDVDGGRITVDGVDIKDVRQADLRKAISYVPQDPILFHRSLYENIRYGKYNAAKEEVEKAAKLSHSHEFIASLKEGYQTFVGERGVKLSGGERQRVALARAFLRDSPILILDEATSALDSESERLIQDSLHKLLVNKTAIVIAHRLSTIMQMDRIVVVDEGKIVEQGTHNDLLSKRGLYAKLWEIQSGGFIA